MLLGLSSGLGDGVEALRFLVVRKMSQWLFIFTKIVIFWIQCLLNTSAPLDGLPFVLPSQISHLLKKFGFFGQITTNQNIYFFISMSKLISTK